MATPNPTNEFRPASPTTINLTRTRPSASTPAGLAMPRTPGPPPRSPSRPIPEAQTTRARRAAPAAKKRAKAVKRLSPALQGAPDPPARARQVRQTLVRQGPTRPARRAIRPGPGPGPRLRDLGPRGPAARIRQARGLPGRAHRGAVHLGAGRLAPMIPVTGRGRLAPAPACRTPSSNATPAVANSAPTRSFWWGAGTPSTR